MASPLIYRKRLINAINAPGHHIVYVYGPSGFGKSTLARDWMESQTLPTAWVQGFSTSNPGELFEVFLKEISNKVPHLKSKLATLLKVEKVQLEHIKKFAEILENDKTPFNIVIDNAEEIRRTHNELSMAIVRHMPIHIKFILVTTTSPRSEFIKEAGVTRFAVVGPEDLRFNRQEVKQLAQEAIPTITEKELDLIVELTEGWPSSAEIVTSLLRNNPEFRNELTTLGLKGKQQFAIEANKVLAKLEDGQRDLLKQLSPLQEISPEMAYSLINNVDVVRQLTLLSQDTIVISQLTQTPPRFRIHPIFRDVLIDELRREASFNQHIEKVIEGLLAQKEIRQASSLLVEMGETPRLGEILRDPDLMRAIGASIQDAIWRAATNELRDWAQVADHLPIDGDKGKAIINFYVEFLSGNLKAAEMQIEILKSEIAKGDQKQANTWQAELLVLQSLIAYAKGNLSENWRDAIAAFELKRSDVKSQTKHQLSYLKVALWGAFISDNDAQIRQIAQILDEISAAGQLVFRQSTVAAMRCLIAAHEGRLKETQNYLITPFTGLTHSKVQGYFGPFGTRFAEAVLAGEFGDLEKSAALLVQNIDEAIAAHNYPIAIASLGRLAYHLTLLRRAEEGLARIEQAHDLIRIHTLSDEMNSVIDMWEIRVRHFMLDNERVNELLKRCAPSYFVRSFQAAAYIASGNFDAARNLIETFDLQVPRQAITRYLFNAYLLKDSPTAQLKEIAKAVELGSKHGYFHHFITQRSDILQQYISLASEFPTAFNERLARAAGEELNKMMVAKSETGDALTRREADILRHLATGLPLKDIAANLSISKNTIKTHLRNLYRKLGAEDRNDAVEKGKKLLKV